MDGNVIIKAVLDTVDVSKNIKAWSATSRASPGRT